MKNLLRTALVLSLFLGAGSLLGAPAADLPPQAEAPAAAAAVEAGAADTTSPLMRTVFESEKRNVSCWDDCQAIFTTCKRDCHGDSTCISACFDDLTDCRDLC